MTYLGGKTPIGYQGGKSGYAPQILHLLGLSPGQGRTAPIHLVELGPFADFWIAMRDHRPALLNTLISYAPEDPRELFRRLAEAPPPADPIQRAAAFAALQFWSFAKKPVTPLPNKWKHHGFNASEAYASQRRDQYLITDRTIPYLIDRIRQTPDLSNTSILRADARSIRPFPSTVLIDPPYQNTTSQYPASLPRADVLQIAAAWRDAGAIVAICEQEPLHPQGTWWHAELRPHSRGRKWSRQQREVLTISQPPRGQIPLL